MLRHPETGRPHVLAHQRPSWRRVPIAFGWGAGVLVSAAWGAGLFAYTQLASANDGAAGHGAATAYAFGYASAASAVCGNVPLDLVSAHITASPQGRVSADIAQGFADFSSTLETAGVDRACSAAARMVRIRK